MSNTDEESFLTEIYPLLEQIGNLINGLEERKVIFIAMCLMKTYLENKSNKDEVIEEIVKHLKEGL